MKFCRLDSVVDVKKWSDFVQGIHHHTTKCTIRNQDFTLVFYYLALDDEDVAVLDLISKTANEVGKQYITGSSAKEPEAQDYTPESKYSFACCFSPMNSRLW